jgi:multicomponent Na+:H+ antiporter subunit D
VTLSTVIPPAILFLAAAVVTAAVSLVLTGGSETERTRAAGETASQIAHGVGAVVAGVALAWVLAVPTGTHLSFRAFGSAPAGFEVVLFTVDPISRAVGTVFTFVALADLLYAVGTGASSRQAATTLVYAGASLGVVFAGDWLTVVIWWEVMALAATALLWQSTAAVRAAYRYAVYHQLGGALLTAGVLLQYVRTGTFLFSDGVAAGLPVVLVTLGVGVNVGFLGVHVWIVDAYPRPDVASTVVLSGFTTKVGVYTLTRVFPGEALPLAYLGGAMVLVGVTMAILQTDVRRLLSYHIISQVGYMVAGIGLGTTAGVAGGIAHLFNNVLYKTLLFMVAGIVVLETGRESLKKLGGLGRRLPGTAVAFAVAALAITGIPGFSGFLSKGFITSAATAADAGELWWILQIGAVGTVISFLKFGYYAFLRAGQERREDQTQAGASSDSDHLGPSATVALALLAVPCVVFGVAPEWFTAFLPGTLSTATAFSVSKLTDAAVITAVGVVGFALLRQPLARVSAVPDLERLYHPAGRTLHDWTSRTAVETGTRVHEFGRRAVTATRDRLRNPTVLESRGLERASIGRGILLVTLAVALALAALVWSL